MIDPRQQTLLDAWHHEAENHNGLPPRDAFDPIEFPHTLSTLILAELKSDKTLCFRLVGTDMVEAWGTDFTGKHLHEIMEGEYHDFIRGLFDECIARQVPIYSHSRFQWDRGRAVDTRRLMLPFAAREGADEVAFVLVSQVFDYGKLGPQRPTISTDRDFNIIELARERLKTATGG